MKRILVTGAYGYIGSHVVKTAAEYGYRVTALDMQTSVNQIEPYIEKFYKQDILRLPHSLENFDAVIHLAARIDVHESTQDPAGYYETNIMGTKEILDKVPTDHFIFGSTGAAIDPVSPYALSKVAAEDIVRQYYPVGKRTIFRFFNVAGSGGFSQIGRPTHLIRIAARVAAGKQPSITINGNDFDTPDGTCLREYIHVQDVANCIVSSIDDPSFSNEVENISPGIAHSNKEVVETMQEVCHYKFPVYYGPRREGDAARLQAPSTTRYLKDPIPLDKICESAYNKELSVADLEQSI